MQLRNEDLLDRAMTLAKHPEIMRDHMCAEVASSLIKGNRLCNVTWKEIGMARNSFGRSLDKLTFSPSSEGEPETL